MHKISEQKYNDNCKFFSALCCLLLTIMIILIVLTCAVGFPLAAWFTQSSTWTSWDVCLNNTMSNCLKNCDCGWCFNDIAKYNLSWCVRFDEAPQTCANVIVEIESCPANNDGYYIVGASVFALLFIACIACGTLLIVWIHSCIFLKRQKEIDDLKGWFPYYCSHCNE